MYNYYRNPWSGPRHKRWGSTHPRARQARMHRPGATPWARNPSYRRNLLPYERRVELQEKSPGNFRRPTLAVTEEYLDTWKRGGIEKPEDFTLYQFQDFARQRGTTPALERAQEQNRFDEASFYWNDYQTQKQQWDLDPSSYEKPRYSEPRGGYSFAVEDVRDYGDYSTISGEQAYHYLYQFLHRNAQKRADGEAIDDVRVAPFKWRYREAVLEVGPEVASKLVKRTFASLGLRAPKWYLPENLYDDLGDLFPEVEEAGEAAEASRRFSRRGRRSRLRRYNPW